MVGLNTWFQLGFICLAMGVLFGNIPQIYARFLDGEINQVDAEERLGLENYNDELTYEPLLPYQGLIQTKNTKAFFNAGSYNAKRFMWHEIIEFATEPGTPHPVDFAFHHDRQVNLISDITDRYFELSLNLDKWHPLLRVDSSSFKSSSDFALGLRYNSSYGLSAEFIYWSVDHIFNEKVEDPDDRLIKQSKSYEMKVNFYNQSSPINASLSYIIDTPLDLLLVSQHYQYHYEQHRTEVNLRYFLSSNQNLRLEYSKEFKKEGKSWNKSLQETFAYKILNRHAQTMRLEYTLLDKSISQLGLWATQRIATYDQFYEPDEILSFLTEKASPDMTRKEWAFYFRHLFAQAAESRHQFQLGTHCNRPLIKSSTEGLSEDNLEISIQTAWIYRFWKNFFGSLNFHWDIDRLIDRYPYAKQENEFNPWGGGNIQLVASF